MKRVNVLGMEVRLSTVVVSAALILFIVGAWIYSALRPEPAVQTPTAPTVTLPTATPEPTATAAPTATPEPTATTAPETPAASEPTPVGDWQSGYYAMPGLAVLKACHGFAGMVGSTTDVPKDVVDRMIAAYPGKGDFLAVARAFVPRTGKDPVPDLEAWLNSVVADCSRSPWTEEALKAITESGKNSLIGYAILRPVTTLDGKDAWEYVVYVMP